MPRIPSFDIEAIRLAGLDHPLARVGAAAVFLLLAVVIYQGTLKLPLTSDAQYLTYRNTFVQNPGGLVEMWTEDYFLGSRTHATPARSGYYRPVTNTLFWLEYRIAGTRDWLYTLGSIVLHGLNAFLVFLLCLRVMNDRLAAALAGLFFVLHPVHAFAATEPAARADVLFPLFYLLGLLAFDSALRGGSRVAVAAKLALTVVFYLAAALSKEMGVTLPAALVLLVLYRHFRQGMSLRRLAWTVPAWAAFGVYLVWRFLIVEVSTQSIGYGEVYSPFVLALGALRGILIHISRIVLPLGAQYPELNPWVVNFVGVTINDPFTYVAIAVVLALAALALAWKWNPLLAFWSGFFLVSFSPLLSVESISGTTGHGVLLAEERWIYLPAVALAAAIGWGAAKLARSERSRLPRPALAAAGLVVFLMLGWTAVAHAGRHKDPFARLRRLYLLPEEQLDRLDLANKRILYATWVALPMGNLDEAEARAREAYELVPDSPIPAAALAEVLSRRGEWEEVVSVLGPWLNPSVPFLERQHATNFRVYDDVNRVASQMPYLMARAFVHLRDGERAAGLLCDAVNREFDQARIADVLRENYALNGPPSCGDAVDPGSCAAGVTLPAADLWLPPYDAGTCRAWMDFWGGGADPR